jgi:tRNA (guanosine-2'-O-)-methyltransferase
MTPEREEKVNGVAERRFADLEVILENVDDPHNIGAILRTCDAVGVGHVHLVYTKGKPPRMGELKTNSAASAAKWLTISKWEALDACLAELRTRGRKLYVTTLSDTGKPQWETDLAAPCVVAMGNEHDGASPELIAAADGIITIPMRGMVQSLNVSVATAVILEDALRQRLTST